MLKKLVVELTKEEFIKRVNTILAQNVSETQLTRLATFLSLNEEHPNMIQKEAWIHQLRRSKHSLHIADRDVIPIMCCKLLRNESAFKS
jgi:hypothetical protein